MMASLSPTRLNITEYGAARSIAEDAQMLGIEGAALRALLQRAAVRMVKTLAVSEPLVFEGDGWRVQDVAGLLRLAPNLELEIVPKFLDANDATWREDFFAVATLVRFGRVLPREALRSNVGEKGDLADLIGHAIVEMYDRNRARPLWVYRRRSWRSLDVDGELDPESVLLPDDDGFLQSDTVLDRQNRYNWTIQRAMETLLPEIRNGDVRRRLSERRAHLSPQRDKPIHRRGTRLLPSRHQRWQHLYDLSNAVLDGFGVSLSLGQSVSSPGYVLKTADAWESLLLLAVRSGMPECSVTKEHHPFATRVSLLPNGSSRRSTVAKVTPDITIIRPDGTKAPLDAKYKGRVSAKGVAGLSISASDLYEATAFMAALDAPQIALIYPWPSGADSAPSQTGKTTEFEHIFVRNQKVIGLAVDVRGIAGANGFRNFADGLCAGVRKVVN